MWVVCHKATKLQSDYTKNPDQLFSKDYFFILLSHILYVKDRLAICIQINCPSAFLTKEACDIPAN